MKAILLLFLLLPFTVTAQTVAKPDVKPARHWAVEGFAEAGYAHEFWTLSNGLSSGYSAMSYGGEGGYFGGGFRSVVTAPHVVGYGLSLNYLKYQMEKTLIKEQHLSGTYSFMKVSPMVYLNVNTKSAYHVQLCGVVSIMAALQAGEHTYVQYGGKVCVGYQAYEANMGIGFSNGIGPDTDIKSKWREQMLTIGIACYPGRIPFIKQNFKKKSAKATKEKSVQKK